MKFLESCLRWIVIVGIFALPVVAVIVADSLFFPYITGKNFTFRIVVEIITCAWLALALVNPQYRPKRSWILGAFAVFVLLIALSDWQGVNPFKSFWSNFERMDGWITIAHLLCYLVVAACVIQTERLWRLLFHWSLAISAFIAVLGFMQAFNVLSLGGSSGNTGLEGRIDATFGNPIYLAAYMLFQVFIAAFLWVQEGKENWRMPERILLAAGPFVSFLIVMIFMGSQLTPQVQAGLFVLTVVFIAVLELLTLITRRWLLAIIIVLDTAALLLTGTRGTTLGLIGGAALALILFAFSSDASRTFRRVTTATLVVLVVAAGGLWLARDSALVQRVGFLDRLATISLTDDTVKARLLNIGIAWQGVKERPLLGWGQENYAIVFDKYYDPRMYGQEQWFDRVHDIIFDWWIAGGTLGLLAYLSIFAAALWVLWRSSEFSAAERAIFTGLLAGYFVHNLAVFDNITSYILFGTILAYLVFRDRSRVLLERPFVPKSTLAYALPVALIVGCMIVWAVNGNALAANQDLIAALQQQQGGPTENLALFEKAISYNSLGTQEAREQLSQIAAEVVQTSGIPTDLKQQYLTEAVEQLNLQSQVSPLDARFPLFAGSLLDAAGDYQDAWTQLQHALELSPRKQTILFEMVQNAENRGDMQTAVSLAQEAYQLDTQDSQALLVYASALIRAGSSAEGQSMWQQYFAQNPQDSQGYFTIAGAYYQAGERAQAIAMLKLAEQAVPSVKSQADQLILQIQTSQ